MVATYVLVRLSKSNERVYMKLKLSSNDFTYVYEFLFKKYDVNFLLTGFEVGRLTTMNVVQVNYIPIIKPS